MPDDIHLWSWHWGGVWDFELKLCNGKCFPTGPGRHLLGRSACLDQSRPAGGKTDTGQNSWSGLCEPTGRRMLGKECFRFRLGDGMLAGKPENKIQPTALSEPPSSHREPPLPSQPQCPLGWRSQPLVSFVTGQLEGTACYCGGVDLFAPGVTGRGIAHHAGCLPVLGPLFRSLSTPNLEKEAGRRRT